MTRRERASIIIRVMITMIIMIGLFNVLNYINRHEEKRGVVVNIDDNDCITVIDGRGEEWQFFGDGFKVGESVIIVMDTQGTPEEYDDTIIDTRTY